MADLSIVKSEPLRLVSSQPLPAEQGFVPAAKAALQTAGQFAKGIGGMAWHAMESVAGDDTDLRKDAADAVKAQDEQWDKAKAAWQRGDKTEAFGHLLAAGIPLLGPSAAHAGERIGGELQYDTQGHPTGVVRQPDPSGGIGEAVVNAGAPLAAEAIRRAPGVASRVSEAVAGVGNTISSAAKVAGDVATSPAARDVVGIVSPRLKHGLDLAARVKRAADAFQDRSPQPAATPTIPEPPAPTPQAAAPSGEISAADVARMSPAEFAKLPVQKKAAAQATADSLNAMMRNANGAGPAVLEVPASVVGTGQPSVSPAAPAAVEPVPQATGPIARPAQPVAPQPGTPASAVAQQFAARSAGAPVQMPSVATEASPAVTASPVPKANGISALPASSISKLTPQQIAQMMHDEMAASGSLAELPKTEQPVESINPFEASARTAKATKLADVLHQGGISLDDARSMDASHWKLLSKGLGLNAPSEATISEALNQLEGLQKASGVGTGKPSASPAAPAAIEPARAPTNGSARSTKAPALTPELEEQVLRAWSKNRVYIDGNGNYHLKPTDESGQFLSNAGPIAPWNKAVKGKYESVSDLHDAAQRYKTAPATATSPTATEAPAKVADATVPKTKGRKR